MPPPKTSFLPKLYLFLAVAIWGIATPIIKATGTTVPPFTFLMLRFLVSGVITIPLSIYVLRHYKIGIQRVKKIFVSSILGNVISLSLIFWGLSKTTSLEGSILTSFSPLLIAILGFFFLKEILNKKKIEGILIAFIGTLIILGTPILETSNVITTNKESFFGNILFFGGILFDGLYVIYIKKYLSQDKIINSIILTILSFSIATIIFIPIGLLEQRNIYKAENYGNIRICTFSDIDAGKYSAEYKCNFVGCFSEKNANQYECIINDNIPSFVSSLRSNIENYIKSTGIIGISYMAIFSGILAYIFFQKGLKNLKASESAIFYYLQPLFGIPISIAFLQEKVSLLFVIGSIIIILGIYLAEFRKN